MFGKNGKRAIAAIAAALLLLAMAGCGENGAAGTTDEDAPRNAASTADSSVNATAAVHPLEGRWENQGGGNARELEFFSSDGTAFVGSDDTITWRTNADGNRLSITWQSSSSLSSGNFVLDYEITNNGRTLELTYDGDSSYYATHLAGTYTKI